MAISPDGRLAALHCPGTRVFDVASGDLLFADYADDVGMWPSKIMNPALPRDSAEESPWGYSIHTTFSNDSRTVINIRLDGRVRHWSVEKRTIEAEYRLEELNPPVLRPLELRSLDQCRLNLKSTDAQEKRLALYELMQRGPLAKDAVIDVVLELDDPSPRARAMAIHTLVAIGSKDHVPAEKLLDALKSRDSELRKEAAYAIVRLNLVDQVPVENLIEALSDKDAFVQMAAAQMIGNIGSRASAAVPALAKLLETPSPDLDVSDSVIDASPREEIVTVRESAAQALLSIGRDSRGAFAVLMRSLRDPVASIREIACRTMEIFGEDAMEALPVLMELLRDSDADVRAAAKNAIAVVRK